MDYILTFQLIVSHWKLGECFLLRDPKLILLLFTVVTRALRSSETREKEEPHNQHVNFESRSNFKIFKMSIWQRMEVD